MSKSTLSTLKSEINMASKYAYNAESTLRSLEKSISSAMNDRVGNSARDSLTAIGNCFSNNMDRGFKGLNNGVGALERGYTKIESLSKEKDKHITRAHSIVKGLGDL